VTLGEVASSSYTKASKTFSLNAHSPNAETKVNHFVYQPLARDGSIVAKVQLAASSSSTAKAGLMLRQNNEATSPFVFAYVSNGKILVEYLDVATNQVVTVEGGVLSAATEARFLKIERKEGSVYVYESGDSLNFRQIAVVGLLLTNPVNVGLVTDATNGFAQVQVDSVLVQAQEKDQSDIEIVEVKGPEGGSIIHNFYTEDPTTVEGRIQGIASVTFYENTLKAPTEIKLNISKTPAMNYPDLDYFKNNYPLDKVKYLGPLLTVELPLSAMDWEGEEEEILVDLSPSFYKGVLATTKKKDIFIEVRILRPDGQLVFYAFDYGFFGEALINNKFLQTNLDGSIPETLVISVQAVDLSQVLPSSEDVPSNLQNQRLPSQNLRTFQAQTQEDPTKGVSEQGLFHIHVDAGFSASTFAACSTNDEPKNVTGFTKVTQPITLPEGKTPLVLVHGWRGLGYFQ
jgi:hypothetical protein